MQGVLNQGDGARDGGNDGTCGGVHGVAVTHDTLGEDRVGNFAQRQVLAGDGCDVDVCGCGFLCGGFLLLLAETKHICSFSSARGSVFFVAQARPRRMRRHCLMDSAPGLPGRPVEGSRSRHSGAYELRIPHPGPLHMNRNRFQRISANIPQIWHFSLASMRG